MIHFLVNKAEIDNGVTLTVFFPCISLQIQCRGDKSRCLSFNI